jgi:aconitate hydratase
VLGLSESAKPLQPVTLAIQYADGRMERVTLTLRLDTQAEIEYVKRGGILPYVLEGLAA